MNVLYLHILDTFLAFISLGTASLLAWKISATNTKVEAMWTWFMNERLHEKEKNDDTAY
jgi:hypothetical protein